jgi:GntR family transcriptional regulator
VSAVEQLFDAYALCHVGQIVGFYPTALFAPEPSDFSTGIRRGCPPHSKTSRFAAGHRAAPARMRKTTETRDLKKILALRQCAYYYNYMHNDTNAFQKSRMPLYLQVAKLMRQKIESHEWRLGEQIPTLDELLKEYQVSKITLRAALAQLEEQGMIRRTRGLGTFVAKDLSEQRWFKLPTNWDDLLAAVVDLKIRLLLIEQAEHPLKPAFKFGEVGPAYHRLKRVHYHNEEPYCLIEIYLEKDVFALAPTSFTSAPVLSTLAALPDVQIAHGKQIMRITVSDEDTATHLDIGVGDPIADVCRTLVDQNNRIVYYAHIQYPAQMIQIETSLL